MTSTNTTEHPTTSSKSLLQKRILHRQASLTEGESAFLHALLIDPAKDESSRSHSQQMENAAHVLNDDILFSVPPGLLEGEDTDAAPPKAPPKAPKKRRSKSLLALWKAFEEGINPRSLVKRAPPKPKDTPPADIIGVRVRRGTEDTERHGNLLRKEVEEILAADQPQEHKEDSSSSFDDTIRSDERVLGTKTDTSAAGSDDEASSASSWSESSHTDHFDSWDVLKDEYAGDFGFDYSLRNTPGLDENEEGNKFIILGTSADDRASQPHVLSPPLMDSLMNFLPEALTKQNWWLKYSLVRDGASLSTLKRYVRGAQYVVLAIETTAGDVFGAFTASTWRTGPNFYGSGEAFLWKMRYNRMAKCTSLFEQAQMESDIDVYVYSHLNRFVQLCTHDLLAIGGGDLPEVIPEYDDDASTVETPTHFQVELDEETGFGIALSDDLLHGTSSPCATFRNPCLVHHSSRGEPFEVINIEAWTFTPCYDVDSAEKLEMTKFFIQESTRSVGSSTHSYEDIWDSSRCSSPSFSTTSRDRGYLSSSAASTRRGYASSPPPGSSGYVSSPGTSRERRTSSSRSPPRFSSRDLVQKKFYRRVGEEDESEQKRDRWAYANMMGGVGI